MNTYDSESEAWCQTQDATQSFVCFSQQPSISFHAPPKPNQTNHANIRRLHDIYSFLGQFLVSRTRDCCLKSNQIVFFQISDSPSFVVQNAALWLGAAGAEERWSKAAGVLERTSPVPASKGRSRAEAKWWLKYCCAATYADDTSNTATVTLNLEFAASIFSASIAVP